MTRERAVLSIEVDEGMYRRLKAACALAGLSIRKAVGDDVYHAVYKRLVELEEEARAGSTDASQDVAAVESDTAHVMERSTR